MERGYTYVLLEQVLDIQTLSLFGRSASFLILNNFSILFYNSIAESIFTIVLIIKL